MAWVPTAYTLIGLTAAAISLAVAVDAWLHRSERTALPFMALMLTLAAWSLVYAVQLGFGTLAEQLVWQRLTFTVAGVVPTAWLVFTLQYAGYDSWLTPRWCVALAGVPVAFAALSMTNPLHGLVWTDPRLGRTPAGPVLDVAFGPGYGVHIVYAYLLVAVGIGLLLVVAGRTWRLYHRQVGLLVAGAIPPFLGHVSFTLGVGPVPTLDPTPFVFAVTGLLFGFALFRFDLLERTPVARERALDETGDGLVVVDEAGLVVDVMGAAPVVMGSHPEVGTPLADALPVADLASADGTTLAATIDGVRRTYHLRVSRLVDHHVRTAGHVLVLRDVTGLRAYEQRLEVANRVLRHNLRNEMNVIAAYARDIEEGLDGRPRSDARTIRETAERLADMGEKARWLTRSDGESRGEPTAVDVVDPIEDLLVEFRADHPRAEFDLDVPTVAPASVVDPETFRVAVRNVIENAVEHNDSATPRIRVRIRVTDDRVRIRVTDNGPGIPEMERTVLDAGTETPLHHSQGLGLWIAYWGVTGSGGTIEFETGDDRTGTAVTLAFRRAGRIEESTRGDEPPGGPPDPSPEDRHVGER
jgi:signal transduction histidine kinase